MQLKVAKQEIVNCSGLAEKGEGEKCVKYVVVRFYQQVIYIHLTPIKLLFVRGMNDDKIIIIRRHNFDTCLVLIKGSIFVFLSGKKFDEKLPLIFLSVCMCIMMHDKINKNYYG
jgi:hypothetical protein